MVYRDSTGLDRRSTRARKGAGMSERDQAGRWSWSWSLPPLGAVTESLDRGFDWGSAAVGAGAGAAVILLLVAAAAIVRSRGSRDGDVS